jgi:hypothetical protein
MNNDPKVPPMVAAANRAVTSTNPLPLDKEIRKLKKRGWLRDDVDVRKAIRFAHRSLVIAVDRGWAEQQAASSQSDALAQWAHLSDTAKKAAKSLDTLTKLSKFKIADLQVLCTKQHLTTGDFSESSTATLRAVQRQARGTAARLHSSIIAARQTADTIADQANAMARGIAEHKHAPGKPFRRGFVIEMMKTWWLVTGRSPSTKRSNFRNPFVDFADAALRSIDPDSDLLSCAGVVRSAFPIFLKLQESGAFDSVLSEITDDDDDAGRAIAFAALKKRHIHALVRVTRPLGRNCEE